MKSLTIYIASSWKNRHAVEMLTDLLRRNGHAVRSFIENENAEQDKGMPFEEWLTTDLARRSFEFDTNGATTSDLVIYVGPSGTDAWAEVGAAWASSVPIFGLWAKGEQAGLMRKMVGAWFSRYSDMLTAIERLARREHRDESADAVTPLFESMRHKGADPMGPKCRCNYCVRARAALAAPQIQWTKIPRDPSVKYIVQCGAPSASTEYLHVPSGARFTDPLEATIFNSYAEANEVVIQAPNVLMNVVAIRVWDYALVGSPTAPSKRRSRCNENPC